MSSLQDRKKRARALGTFHRIVESEERNVARELAASTERLKAEQAKLQQLSAYYSEYLENMRQSPRAEPGLAAARVRQQQFLGRLQGIIEQQQHSISFLEQQAQSLSRHWQVARQREQSVDRSLKVAQQAYQQQLLNIQECELEEESLQRRQFLK